MKQIGRFEKKSKLKKDQKNPKALRFDKECESLMIWNKLEDLKSFFFYLLRKLKSIQKLNDLTVDSRTNV